ncbi:MAG: fumarylacetoacetate hydrolase family protein [bacterium]
MKTIKIKNSSKEYNVGKIVCVGKNYAAHIKEMGGEVPEFPLIFLKPSSSLIFSGQDIPHPDYSNDLQHEVELVLLIGKTVKNANKQEAEEAIAGYSVGLDMTLRDLQRTLVSKGHPWTLAKCFDNSAVVGNFIDKKECNLTLNETITLSVNGTIRQKSLLNMMLYKPVEIVEYISKKITLEEGDLIFTGTPEGVSKVNVNDLIYAKIENVSELSTLIV